MPRPPEDIPPAPPAPVIEELKGYEVAWLSDAMELNLMDSAIRAVHPTIGRVVGPAVTVQVPPGDFLMIPEAMTRARPGDVRVMNLRSRARFTQKARASNWIFRQLHTDNFECDEGI